jgi:hypothetical protein
MSWAAAGGNRQEVGEELARNKFLKPAKKGEHLQPEMSRLFWLDSSFFNSSLLFFFFFWLKF